MAQGEGATLKRAIGLPHATALVVGTIIGASIFVQPSEITGRVPSFPGAMAAWLAAGVLTLLGALVAAELAAAFPQSGGIYVFLRELFSPLAGFLWGWAMFWTIHTGVLAAIAVVFARYLAYFVPLSPLGGRLAAVAAILVLSAVNVVGVRAGSRLQTALTAVKVAAILFLVGAGVLLDPRRPGSAGGAGALDGAFLGGASAGDFLIAVGAGLFAFGGWHMVTYSAEETVEPRRTVPRALALGTLLVTACYLALNAVYLRVLPIETVAGSERVAADFAEALLGPRGGALVSALVVVSTFGALSGIVLSGPRVYLAMARDGLLFSWMGTIHPRFATPHVAIALQGVLAAVLAATGTYRALFSRVIYTEWLFFGLLALGIYRLRRRQAGNPAAFRLPLWVPAVFALAAFGVVANHFIVQPREALLGLSFLLLGAPVYGLWLWIRRRREAPP